jgi:uncharacterized protein DUF5655
MAAESRNVVDSASPEAVLLYRRILTAARRFGAFREELKKTSVHLARKSAFVGIHFRRTHLLLTIKSHTPLDSPRIVKTEQVSKNRWHCEVRISATTDIDREIIGWMKSAYDLSI